MITTKLIRAAGVAALTALAGTATAGELSADQIARLDADLTPVGAIRAGNEAGTIPAWEGGIKSPADAGFPDFKSGGHHPDPYASDQVLYTVNAANMAQYADILTEGQKEALEAVREAGTPNAAAAMIERSFFLGVIESMVERASNRELRMRLAIDRVFSIAHRYSLVDPENENLSPVEAWEIVNLEEVQMATDR